MQTWGEGPAALGIGKGAPLSILHRESVDPPSGPELIPMEELQETGEFEKIELEVWSWESWFLPWICLLGGWWAPHDLGV